MTEAEVQEMLKRNPALRIRDQRQKPDKPIRTVTEKAKPMFDSFAEEKYYREQILPLVFIGQIVEVEMHRRFEILPAVKSEGVSLRSKSYTPDFILYFSDSHVEVIEVKGTKIKKLQRDFELRKHLFIVGFCIPNGWQYKQIVAEEITRGECI